MECCSHSQWKSLGSLDHTLGEFSHFEVEHLELHTCEACHAYRLDVQQRGGRTQALPVERERAERIRAANAEFWKRLRPWARS